MLHRTGKPLWQGGGMDPGLQQRCNFPVEPNTITPEEFRVKYLEPQKPAVIRNITAGWPAESTWDNVERLNAAYGSDRFFVGAVTPMFADTNSLLLFLRYMTSSEVTQPQPPKYLWDDGTDKRLYSLKRHPLEDTEIPNVVANQSNEVGEAVTTTIESAAFTISPACRGSGFHAHSDAYCVLLKGSGWFETAGTSPRRLS